MFDNKTGLNTEVKFAVAAVYESFNKKWEDFYYDKLSWIDTWSEILSDCNIDAIRAASEYSANNLQRSPTVFEFRTICQRIENKERLDAPIVSKVERIARNILEADQEILGYETLTEFMDACLIAASIASSITNRKAGIEWDKNTIDVELLGRARMFGYECIYWTNDAEKEKGYWADLLNITE